MYTNDIATQVKELLWNAGYYYEARIVRTDSRVCYTCTIIPREGTLVKTRSQTFELSGGVKASYDIAALLHCVRSDARMGAELFADFCDELGYDVDSRNALDTYLKCQESALKLRKLGIPAAAWAEIDQVLENY